MKTRLRVPIFDIDQNLTTKDIPFLLEKGGKVEKFISVDWRQKLSEGYNWVDGDQEKSFIYGRDTGEDGHETYPKYIQGVIADNAFGPSFSVFKDTVIRANPFGKNTSRGHDISNIIRGTQLLILGTLSSLELEQTHEAIHTNGRNTKSDLIDALDDYIGQQVYTPIHNFPFLKTHNIDYNIPYHDKKAMVTEHIVTHISNIYKKYFAQKHCGISIGFSDDDLYNINAVNEWGLKNRDWLHNQNIHFTTYHTSPTNTIKRKITDKTKMNTLL